MQEGENKYYAGLSLTCISFTGLQQMTILSVQNKLEFLLPSSCKVYLVFPACLPCKGLLLPLRQSVQGTFCCSSSKVVNSTGLDLCVCAFPKTYQFTPVLPLELNRINQI